jgi:5'(3')-deoxyribonucleotidase
MVTRPHKPRVFLDKDGVLGDFAKRRDELLFTSEQMKDTPGAYASIEVIPGAREAVSSIIGMGFEVFVATKPPTGRSFAYADKAEWVMRNFPELKRHIILTHDKGLLGNERDFLVDDRPHKANCDRFRGTLIPFHQRGEMGFKTWPQVLEQLRTYAPNRARAKLRAALGRSLAR